MENADVMRALRRPFKQQEIEWRVQQAGERDGRIWAIVLPYITSRAVMDRLDGVFGIEGWSLDILPLGDKGFLAQLHLVKMGVHKTDGAPTTDIESIKGGISDAIKRVAVQVGIGRYLYDLPMMFAIVGPNGVNKAKTKDGKWFKWDAPTLPDWALPEEEA